MTEGEAGGENRFSEEPKPQTVARFEDAARESTSRSLLPGVEFLREEDGRTLEVHTFPRPDSKVDPRQAELVTTFVGRINSEPEEDGEYNGEGIRVEREGDLYRVDRVAARYRRDSSNPNLFYIIREQQEGYTQIYTPIEPPVTEDDLQAEIKTLDELMTPANIDKLTNGIQVPTTGEDATDDVEPRSQAPTSRIKKVWRRFGRDIR